MILCSGGIDDLCLKYFVESGAMGVRRVKKSDLKRIAKATGASFLTSLTNMDGLFINSYIQGYLLKTIILIKWNHFWK